MIEMPTKNKESLDYLDGISRVPMVSMRISGRNDMSRREPKHLPDELKGKSFDLKVSPGEENKPLDVFFAKPDTLSYQLTTGDGKGLGWEGKDINTPRSNKQTVKEVENTKTGETFIAIPVTPNHFDKNTRSNPHLQGHLLINKNTWEANPGFAISLNHEQIPVVKNEGRWTVDSKSPLAAVLDFKGAASSTHPEEIYLLTRDELNAYKKKGSRNAWEESTESREEHRVFHKITDNGGGILKNTETRIAKPVTVNGEEMFVLSNKENMKNISIKDTPLETVTAQQAQSDEMASPGPETKSNAVTPTTLRGVIESAYNDLKSQEKFADPESQKALKDEFEKIANLIDASGAEDDPEGARKLHNELGVQLRTNASLSDAGKAFYNSINEILQSGISNNENQAVASGPNKDFGNRGTDQEKPKGTEAVASGMAGAAAGVINGGAQVLGEAIKGIGAGAASLFKMHSDRKDERLRNPDLIAKEREMKTAGLLQYRKKQADVSNSKVDSGMESAYQSRKALETHPTVQKIHAMVDEDPTRIFEAQDLMHDLMNEDPVVKQHTKNLLKQVKGVSNNMQENLELNQLAGNDLDERKKAYEEFNETMSNDPLADTLQDDDKLTLRESLAKLASQLLKFFKELMMKIKSGRSDESQGNTASATM